MVLLYDWPEEIENCDVFKYAQIAWLLNIASARFFGLFLTALWEYSRPAA
jgi:hypothetical protein